MHFAPETFRHRALVALSVFGAACSQPHSPAVSVVPALEPSSGAAMSLSEEPAARVRLWLESSTAQLSDEPFWLAARLATPKDTHLYWSNPGESGLATTATFSAPPGYELSAVRYPGPRSFVSERGATSYGYLEHAALLVQVTPRQRAPQATFAAQVSWLSCGQVCVKESSQVELTLYQDSAAKSSAVADGGPPLAAFIAALPAPYPNLGVEWLSPTELVLRPSAEDQLLEYFVATPPAPFEPLPRSTREAAGALRVSFARPEAVGDGRGVVRALRADHTLYFEVAPR